MTFVALDSSKPVRPTYMKCVCIRKKIARLILFFIIYYSCTFSSMVIILASFYVIPSLYNSRVGFTLFLGHEGP